ncbi:C40 family peptidase [Shewanella gaetbuli]
MLVRNQFMKYLTCLIIMLGLSACSSVPDDNTSKQPSSTSASTAPSNNATVHHPQWNEKSLSAFYQQWKGTPYRFGGLSKRGLDCSGLVYLAYQDILGERVGRTVKSQQSLGKEVARANLQIGDLVFFRVNRNTRHVGVYMGNNQFLHVSTKKGVIISALDNPYWAPKYKFSKRFY